MLQKSMDIPPVLVVIKKQRSEFHSAVILCIRLCIAQQNLSIGVNVVREGSPSQMRSVRLISLGITIRPRSSTRLTIPVAAPDICLRRRRSHRSPVAFLYIYLLSFTNSAASICKQSGMILFCLLFVNAKRAMTEFVIALCFYISI